jgi:hypothetical protein
MTAPMQILNSHASNRPLGGSDQSSELWRDCYEMFGSFFDPTIAYHEFNDFTKFDADDEWTVTQATQGTADVIDGAGGLLQLDAASATADQGVQVQHSTETIKLTAGKRAYFEARVRLTDTIDKAQILIGFSILDTTIFASGEVSATNYVGWVLDATQQAATASTIQLELNSTAGSEEKNADCDTLLVEATFVRLGFKITQNSDGADVLRGYVNGVKVGDDLVITDLPTTEMAVSFACLSEGTNDPILDVDWYRALVEN